MENVQDKSMCLGKLERCYHTIQQFKKRVDSYMYEPTTMALFETKLYLKGRITKLSETNQKLLGYLKSSNEILPEHYKQVNYHIRETFELEFDFLEYTMRFRPPV
ncbi:hypothetical protein [Maribacter ulvicola]|uniref:Uncharacterized protein n=1 Tax=Maribacter ulvicola TaxID=228959 RepID=A0A1N6U927_9FLAO|nr:hypothetical protein [Maribacter ulvicola]SIQ62105.1 hypothetical protein SAMN05421797_102254 [Maribacter ulvicola]